MYAIRTRAKMNIRLSVDGRMSEYSKQFEYTIKIIV